MNVNKSSATCEGILIFGASGHAKVVIDVVERSGFLVQGLFDDNVALRGEKIYGYEVLGGKELLLQSLNLLLTHRVVVAIGSNSIRVSVSDWLGANGGRLSDALVHPSVQLARGVCIGVGSVVMAGSAINSDSRIGCNSIVNTGAVIDHDCIIGDAVHVAPGVTLCGGIKIGNNTLIGAGAVILPNLRIGRNVTIGAGATVVKDVEDGMTVVGSPAKPINKT